METEARRAARLHFISEWKHSKRNHLEMLPMSCSNEIIKCQWITRTLPHGHPIGIWKSPSQSTEYQPQLYIISSAMESKNHREKQRINARKEIEIQWRTSILFLLLSTSSSRVSSSIWNWVLFFFLSYQRDYSFRSFDSKSDFVWLSNKWWTQWWEKHFNDGLPIGRPKMRPTFSI